MVALLVWTTIALPGPSARAAGTPSPYAFAPDARSVRGTTDTAAAAQLEPGATYKSSLPPTDAPIAYRLDLDATSDTYVSVTAIPAPGSTVQAGDGIKVTVKDPDGRSCSLDRQTFGVVRSPRPIAAWGGREISADRTLCKRAGTHHVIVERVGTAAAASDAWGLELFVTAEPPPRRTAVPSAPEAWNSASPTPVSGEGVRRAGGASFASAASVGHGVWTSDIQPGRTLFYKVPLDWGRQLSATAELGSSNSGDNSVVGALGLSLYNPARGIVDDKSTSYDGRRTAVALPPLPPVAYENRFAVPARYQGMRFAGSYYLVVHLADDVGEKHGDGPFELRLRVRVDGEELAGPGYAGESKPSGVFEVAAGEEEAAAEGRGLGVGGGGEDGDTTMTVLAVSGIGTGTAVLVVLGVWAVVARRGVGSSGRA
ncbi:hypothetical protein ACFYNL_17170 [Streptomyces sp. NPDC007808]|uniref:hypothetical protein n=1 Tax=Streptomyces sp. NPDC007808 TaxID=3364779 RepID=UPI0036B40B0F